LTISRFINQLKHKQWIVACNNTFKGYFTPNWKKKIIISSSSCRSNLACLHFRFEIQKNIVREEKSGKQEKWFSVRTFPSTLKHNTLKHQYRKWFDINSTLSCIFTFLGDKVFWRMLVTKQFWLPLRHFSKHYLTFHIKSFKWNEMEVNKWWQKSFIFWGRTIPSTGTNKLQNVFYSDT